MPTAADPLGLEDEPCSSKRLKKKKKKKHRHKDKERKDRDKEKYELLSFSKDPLALESHVSKNRDFQPGKSDFDAARDLSLNHLPKRFDPNNRSSSSSGILGRSFFSQSVTEVMKEEEDDSDISDI